MNSIFEEIKPTIESARAKRAFGEYYQKLSQTEEAFHSYEAALQKLDKAIRALSNELKNVEKQTTTSSQITDEAAHTLSADLESSANEDPTTSPGIYLRKYRHQLAVQLADCYGMKGGIYRRMARYDESIKMHDLGSKYEKEPSYNLSNSYNRTNSIAVRILKEPDNLPLLKEEIAEMVEIVKKQTEQERRAEWWAWADLGELLLLHGKQTEALQAFKQLKSTGARIQDYDITRKMLEELASSLQKQHNQLATDIVEVARYLLNQSVRCFISYSVDDKEFAEQLSTDLKKEGIYCWFSKHDLSTGDKIEPRIDQSVRAHDKLLLVLSQHSIESLWVQKEIDTALNTEKKQKIPVLLPIQLDAAATQIQQNLSHFICDFTAWKDRGAYQQALKQLLLALHIDISQKT